MKRLPLLGFSLACTCVLAHPNFENKIVRAGTAFKADMMVTHGCGDSPTIRLVVDVPEEVLAITPRIKPGWTIETVESDLAKSRIVFGREVTTYTSQIIWSGGSLSSDYFDVFSFIVIPPSEATTLYFPARQICVERTDSYTAIPDPAKPDQQLSGLAPSLTVVESDDGRGD